MSNHANNAVRPGTLVFYAENLDEIQTESPPAGAPNRGGVVSNGDFRPISRYISETLQDRDIVTMER